jgi:diketogulonate reductase-like aldo/keto reductase
MGWDRDVRLFCKDRGIVYQSFSLLTANTEVLRHPMITGLARDAGATPAQVVFAFARLVGMLPITGTSDAAHMKEDLASLELSLSPNTVRAIEFILD